MCSTRKPEIRLGSLQEKTIMILESMPSGWTTQNRIFGVYDFDHYRYIDGPALSCSNIYPQLYSRVFYDGMKAEGEENIVNLLRCAWAGSQKYGNVVWSGDVPSTFEAFYDQLQAGLNMGLAGIPWWTTDIGGFMTDDVNDPDFQQLLIRWYEFAVYSAVFRMHGDRGPSQHSTAR